MTSLVPKCPKAFVLGHPIKHSKSPLLHRAAYRVLERSIKYERLDTVQAELSEIFKRFGPHDGTCGFSVTMPLKSAVIPYLDELSSFAQAVGVVNTVYWRYEHNCWRSYGHNTDVSGIVNALGQAGLSQAPLQAAVLGGGGTATAALAALRFMGCRQVDLLVRNSHRAQVAYEAANRLGIHLIVKSLADSWSHLCDYPLVISTLPAGAADAVVDIGSRSPHKGYLLDVSYDPWPSHLATIWQQSGGKVTSGLEMLMYQAVDQVKLFTGGSVSEELPKEDQVLAAMRKAVGLPATSYRPQQVCDPAGLGMTH